METILREILKQAVKEEAVANIQYGVDACRFPESRKGKRGW
jgi:hypothetical protein